MASRRRRAAWTPALLNVAAIVEKADEQVLPAVFLYIGRSLGCGLPELGSLVLARAAVQALCSPLAGALGDAADRAALVAAGCCLWGVCTAALGLATTLNAARAAAALNGIGLALVIPAISSLLADLHPAAERGHAFGLMGLVSALGGMAGGLAATAAGGRGAEAWRGAFLALAAVSLATGGAVWRWAADPRRAAGAPPDLSDSGAAEAAPAARAGRGAGGGGALANVAAVLRVPSFQVLILQGVVGSMPWQAMAMATLFLQLLGFAPLPAGALVALFGAGCAAGALLGGALGDAAARRAPAHGRVAVCQLSVALSIAWSVLLFAALPRPRAEADGAAAAAAAAQAIFPIYALALFGFGACASWCGANNSVFFADIVPEELRSSIYGWDRSFEGAVGACGAPLVGIVAERYFGFRGSVGAAAAAPRAEREALAAALASALLACLVVPWAFCLLGFGLLHRTYSKDRLTAAGKPASRTGSALELAALLPERLGSGEFGLAAGGAATPRRRAAPGAEDDSPLL